MSDHDTFECMKSGRLIMLDYMARIFEHGNSQHEGSGDKFMFQAATVALNFLVGCRFIVNQGPTEFDRLNSLVGRSDWSFAALDIPEDEILMTALSLGRSLIVAIAERRKAEAGGPATGTVNMNLMLRDAARQAVQLVGEAHASPAVLGLSRASDADIHEQEERMQRDHVMMTQPYAGHA